MTRLDVTTISAAVSAEPVNRCRKLSPNRDDWRCQKHIRRSMDEVCPSLQAKFVQLICGEVPWPLYLYGPVGSGKTRAALALLDEIDFARYWRLGDVMNGIMARDAPWQRPWGPPGAPQLAALDEIGTSIRVGELEYNAVFGFSEWREDQPAIFVSNHEPDMMLKLYDRRIYSRLTCGTVFPLVDVDRRMERPEWLKPKGA